MSRKGGLLLLLLVLAQLPIGSMMTLAATAGPKLTVAAAMSLVPSDGSPHTALYVGLVDEKGNPSPMSSGLQVTITYSDENALSLPRSIEIPPASCFFLV